jgi:hypothetical protein
MPAIRPMPSFLHALHHGLHLLQLFIQFVDVLHGGAGAFGDAALARCIQNIGLAALLSFVIDRMMAS